MKDLSHPDGKMLVATDSRDRGTLRRTLGNRKIRQASPARVFLEGETLVAGDRRDPKQRPERTVGTLRRCGLAFELLLRHRPVERGCERGQGLGRASGAPDLGFEILGAPVGTQGPCGLGLPAFGIPGRLECEPADDESDTDGRRKRPPAGQAVQEGQPGCRRSRSPGTSGNRSWNWAGSYHGRIHPPASSRRPRDCRSGRGWRRCCAPRSGRRCAAHRRRW